ncbi:conserved hypothetical protein [Ricinus communis]|uniref:Protein kinase domain-containing protein n=1 Tax=Ricinus communis TaxID=3988 RepID=B9SSK4_RICCO|nr:conserved hypothetical protein [Ricinus communis]
MDKRSNEVKDKNDHTDNSVGDGSFGTVKDDSCDDDDEKIEYVVKLVYKSEKQSDVSQKLMLI